MKNYVGYAVVFLMLVGKSIGNPRPKREIPSFFMRQFNYWNKNDTCHYEKIKSAAANISQTRLETKIVHIIKSEVAADGPTLNKLELFLEVNGLSKRKAGAIANRKFIANIQLTGKPQHQRNFTFTPVLVREKLLEMTFDITNIYQTSIDGFAQINFTVRIMRRNGKIVRPLMGHKVKPFIILHNRVKSCSFSDIFQPEDVLQLSPVLLRRLENPLPELKSLSDVSDSGLCGVKPFELSYKAIGIDWIIHPEEKDIGICGGLCLAEDTDTGYKFFQNIMHKMLSKGQPSTCRPTELGGMPIIYVDPVDRMPVIAQFSDMVVKQCECS